MWRTSWFLLALSAVWPGGCYSPPDGSSRIMQRIVNARQLYSAPGFSIDLLERDRVAPLAAYMSFGDEAFRAPLSQGLVEVLEARIGAGMVHPNEAINRINAAGLTEHYARMRVGYDRTNILQRDTLSDLASAVEVRYFAVPVMVNLDEALETRFSIFGMRLAKTASANARFQLQVWDGHTGRIVWEGLSDLTMGQETLREERIRFDDLVKATWTNLIDQMPTIGLADVKDQGSM